MKTTLYTGQNRRLIVQPVAEGLQIAGEVRKVPGGAAWLPMGAFTLTPDQAGALIFGIEQAIEATEIAADRQKATA